MSSVALLSRGQASVYGKLISFSKQIRGLIWKQDLLLLSIRLES